MSGQDDSRFRRPEVLYMFDVIPADELPEPGDDGVYPEDEAWSERRSESDQGLPPPALTLEAGRIVMIMTMADLNADDLDEAFAELGSGSYQEAVYNEGAGAIVLVGTADTEGLLWVDFHLGEAGLQGFAYAGLARRVLEARQQAASSDDQPILTSGPLLATVLEAGEVSIGDQLRQA